MQTVVSILELAAAVMAVIALTRRYRKAMRDNPPLAYEPGPVWWRWSTPPDGLTVRQADDASVLVLPRPKRVGSIAAELAAYGIGLLLVAMAVAGLVNDLPPLVQCLPIVLFAPLIPVCLLIATRLERIELRPQSVTFIERGGLWWHRTRVRERPIRVEGKMASVFEVSKDSDPEHEIRLPGGLLSTRMRSACTQSMGTWIVGGLTAWSAADPGPDA